MRNRMIRKNPLPRTDVPADSRIAQQPRREICARQHENQRHEQYIDDGRHEPTNPARSPIISFESGGIAFHRAESYKVRR